jgi:hypothetical protein
LYLKESGVLCFYHKVILYINFEGEDDEEITEIGHRKRFRYD